VSAVVAALTPLMAAILSTNGLTPPPELAPAAVVGLSRDIPPAAHESAQGRPAAAPQQAGTDKKTGQKDEKGKGKEKPRESPVGFRWGDHPSLHLGRGTRIDFRARFQGDLRGSEASVDGAEDDAGLDIAKRRVGIAGEIRNAVDFQIEAELGSTDLWRDVYANYREYNAVQIQGGRFKLPFSLDENTSATNLDFVYRSRAASELAPGRDVGIMVHGRVLRRTLAYETGVFSHDGRNARTQDPGGRVYGGRTLAARVAFQPFRAEKSWRNDLQVGVAFTGSSLEEGFPDLRGRTALNERFYRPDIWVEGQRRRVGAELRWRPGPFSVKSEYIRVTDERLGQSVDDTDLSPLVASGWYLSATWALTGEPKANGLDTPRRPVLRGGVGAIELAARLERLAFGSAADSEPPSEGPRAEVVAGNSDRIVTVGVNWYLNRWVKIQFNVTHDTVRDPSQGPSPGQPGFWSRVLRFQLSI
jgi:phosphate-selective porin OprO/OprP